MNKRYIVAIIGAIGVIVAAIIQKPNKQTAESPQPRQVSETDDNKGGIGVGAVQGSTVGIGSGGGVGVNYGPITNIFSSPPKQTQSDSPRENQGAPPKQQYRPDTRQLITHASAPVNFSLKGKITFAGGVTEPFETLQTSSNKFGPTFLETYNRDSSGLKQNYLDLRKVSKLTFGKSISVEDNNFIMLQILYKNGVEENTYVALNDKLSTGTVGGSGGSSEFTRIERIVIE